MAASPVARSVTSGAASPAAASRLQSAAAPPGRDILAAIGNTPMVEIPSLAPGPDVRLFAKLEGFNPTGSVKDRIALALIESLERRGRLGPGTVLLEATSGNTGIALALVARRRGYPITLVMPDNVTPERRA
ncbi:MAG TPA: pyridoxal-phosphate dependent enzyme, partial [Candidatus Limnocylindrales bacterium]|nr:pyridoxal-phosphate dependent enzyme [Candidatus Limnocylindrales bacterium]